YIHSTPSDEWDRINNQDKARALGYSHGCIHMYPSDIDELLREYVVRRVTTVTIH
ncbi:MAG: L,D-transpeptidase, partial [Desulfovibrionaceae bacterium]|nr:L,D-transpeptidase [Desulfovibrionaceae bacterium]